AGNRDDEARVVSRGLVPAGEGLPLVGGGPASPGRASRRLAAHRLAGGGGRGERDGGDEDLAAARDRGRGRLPVAGQARALVVGDEPGGHRLLRRLDRGP